MHGALDEVQKERLDRVMKAPIDQDALRKAGL
jgi:hypothetical protein